jgi:hypothetical protein
MTTPRNSAQAELWPALPYEDGKDTCTTLHLWTQIVGKVRLAQTPWANHSWHVTLYVTPRGLTTSPIPYDGRAFQIDFDFINHALLIRTSDGGEKRMPLAPKPVADFHDQLMAALAELEIRVRIHGSPYERPNPIPVREDREHAAYDPGYAQRFWRVLVQADRVFKQFRTGFLGKVSPVHFFWGSFDHAVTRFSGRKAPLHPGGVPSLPDSVTREGLEAARKHGRRGGRRYSLTPEKIVAAQEALACPDTEFKGLCTDLGISKATLYRYMNSQGQLREVGVKVMRSYGPPEDQNKKGDRHE